MNITRGKKEQAQKVVVYGPEGIGKTTIASQFPDPVFIDTEGSTANIDVARMDRPTSFTMILQQIKYIKDHPDVCKTLVIDTADWAEQLCISEFCSKKQISGIEDIGYGKGYVYVAEDFGKMLNLLEEVKNLGINIVITAHAQMRKFEQPDELGAYDRWELKLQKKTAPMLKEWADMVLFANYKTMVVNVDNQGATKGKNKAQGGKRVMYTQHHPCWDAKNRHGLPDEVPFEFKSISHCIPVMRNTTENQQQEQAKETKEEMNQKQPSQQPERGATDPKPTAQEKDESKKEENDVPKAVMDLIKAAPFDMYESDIMEVVAQKGYFPKGTRLKACGDDFINGWVIPFWDKILDMIKDNKAKRGEFIPVNQDEMPFN
ncbi:MAG: ATP-binding protein [Clostridiales bacterium]|nr:ATP-binding protein [Clostridiales bacterium]